MTHDGQLGGRRPAARPLYLSLSLLILVSLFTLIANPGAIPKRSHGCSECLDATVNQISRQWYRRRDDHR